MIILGLPIALLVGRDVVEKRLRRSRKTSPEVLERYRSRLINPQWQELEQHFGRAIPENLKELYGDHDFITSSNLAFTDAVGREWLVAEFLPADLETLTSVWDELKQPGIFPLASNGFGDIYYVSLGEEGYPVMIYHHDGSDHEVVSSSLETFLNSQRTT